MYKLARIIVLSVTVLSHPLLADSLSPVTFDHVELNDSFWSSRMKIQKNVLVPIALEKTNKGREDLRRTGLVLNGRTDQLPSKSQYDTSDLYKVVEGAAYLLKKEPDTDLEKKIDSITETIGSAQTEDGYIYPRITGHPGTQEQPYSDVIHSHELYNMGHMYEAAVAYYLTTGKRKLLDIAEKNARHINRVFFEGDPAYNNGKPVNQAPGHQEIELALVKLYQVTGEKLYLDMAKKFLDIRGVSFKPTGKGYSAADYSQQHLPVREQTEAVGHAVRAVYMYCAMADARALTGDKTIDPALNSIWDNIVNTRMHITGGLGAVHGIEGFGPEYELPNKDAYDETCAAVANVLLNYRMFLLKKEAKYMDVAEVALLNNVLAGVSLDGDKFFYVNPLESLGKTTRAQWFNTACCPTNLARTIPQVSGFMYAHSDNDIYCTFYAGSSTEIALQSGKVGLKQETNYPFDEQITISVTPEKDNQPFSLKVRIPTWTGTQFVPGELYHYKEATPSSFALYLNGEKVTDPVVDKGFATLNRAWKKGDKVELRLPMPVRYNKANEKVKADRGRIAITRGPLVYCAEGSDNIPEIQRVFVENIPQKKPDITRHAEGVLRGIDLIRKLPVQYINEAGTRAQTELTLIPYYAWSNRGLSTMIVWMPETEKLARENITVLPSIIHSISASHTNPGETPNSMMGGKFPESSSDTNTPRWTSWPQKGNSQSINISLTKPTDLQSIALYWYDDNGGVQCPKSWNIEYHSGDGVWKPFPLYITDQYTIDKDKPNVIHPNGLLSVKELKVNVISQDNAAVGILNITVEEVK